MGHAGTTDAQALMPERYEQLRSMVDERLDAIWGSDLHGQGGLRKAIAYSLLAQGKRIRPVLMLAAAEALHHPIDADGVVDCAVAVEYIHTYSLVHDDLPAMDDDDLRRGRPTSHRVFGEGVAVLVGDALQAEAFRLLASSNAAPAKQLLACVGELARAAGPAGMVGGQYLDIMAQPGQQDAAHLQAIHDHKTGDLITASVVIGAMLGGARVDDIERWRAFGRELGRLFQLVDDLLDVTGDTALLGKAAGSDERRDRHTAVSAHGLDATADNADSQLARCLECAAVLPDGGGMLADIARYVRSRDR